jgi:DNA-binding NarL/FixJ family response regulator
MNDKLKIFIVDDHDMFRKGTIVLLNKSQKFEFIGEASNGNEFLDMIKNLEPDVVLMDIAMPVLNGIEATRQALQIKPKLKILALSMFGEEEYYYKMIQSGVHGFVIKSAGINELEHAIIEVARGSAYFSPELLSFVKKNIIENKQSSDLPDFTDAETTILKALTENKSDEDIAKLLNKKPADVQIMRQKLLSKTGCNNSSGLIMYAIKNKILVI